MPRKPKGCLKILFETGKTVERYPSRRVASQKNPISSKAISDCCDEKIIRLGKYIFVNTETSPKEIERRCLDAIDDYSTKNPFRNGHSPSKTPIDLIEIETMDRVKRFASMTDASKDLNVPLRKIFAILNSSVGMLNRCILVHRDAKDHEVKKKIAACKEVMARYTIEAE